MCPVRWQVCANPPTETRWGPRHPDPGHIPSPGSGPYSLSVQPFFSLQRPTGRTPVPEPAPTAQAPRTLRPHTALVEGLAPQLGPGGAAGQPPFPSRSEGAPRGDPLKMSIKVSKRDCKGGPLGTVSTGARVRTDSRTAPWSGTAGVSGRPRRRAPAASRFPGNPDPGLQGQEDRLVSQPKRGGACQSH